MKGNDAMHIICTATAKNGTVTHHIVLPATGAVAYTQLTPLLALERTGAANPENFRTHHDDGHPL